MPKIVKTIKGDMIDFDILKIKQSMQSSPAPVEVSERRNFIDNKLKRRINKAKTNIAAAKSERAETLAQEAKEKEELIKAEEKTEIKTVKRIKKKND